MFVRAALTGLPLMRTKTGSGLRQSGFTLAACEELIRTNGLIPRISTEARNANTVTSFVTLSLDVKSENNSAAYQLLLLGYPGWA